MLFQTESAIKSKPIIRNVRSFDHVEESRHIPWSHFITPEIFITKNNDLGAVVLLENIFSQCNLPEINQIESAIASFTQDMGDEFVVYTTIHRRLDVYQFEKNNSVKCQKMVQKKERQCPLFINDLYITLLLKTNHQVDITVKSSDALSKQLNIKLLLDSSKDSQLQKFIRKLVQILELMAVFLPRVLGKTGNDNSIPEAEPLSFLSILINGHKSRFPYPQQKISYVISEKNKFFGHNIIHFRGLMEGDDTFAAIFSIKSINSFSITNLHELLTMPLEYVNTHRFWYVDKNRVTGLHKVLNPQINLSMNKKLLYHNMILISAAEINNLKEKIEKIINMQENTKIMIWQETVNLETAFWSQIPGNFQVNI